MMEAMPAEAPPSTLLEDLDDEQRAELARQRPLDIVAELDGWRAKGRLEPDPDLDALGSIARPTAEAAPEPEQRRPT